MPNYQLYYFPTRGRAEVIRMVFAVAEVPFEDIRVSRSEWSKTKPEMLCGQMPEIHFDGNRLPESRAIYRYLAREHGLFGTNNLEAAKIDAVCCVLEDLMEKVERVVFAPDENTRETLRHKFQNETCGGTMEKLENMLKEYSTDGEFFLGDRKSLKTSIQAKILPENFIALKDKQDITLADIVFFYAFHDVVHIVCSCGVAACLLYHPVLKKIYQNCLRNTNLSKWLEKRPKDEQ